MTTIGTTESQHRGTRDPGSAAATLAKMRFDVGVGGLVMVGPTPGQMAGLETLLERPGIAPVESLGGRLMSWKSASAEAIEVGRTASHAIRQGETAVVHLDSHVGEGCAVPYNLREFVCLRLSQIIMGIADVPAYVVMHSERMARALIVDCLGDEHVTALGTVAGGCCVWELSSDTMFRGLTVSVCPGERDADALGGLIDWLEARRSL